MDDILKAYQAYREAYKKVWNYKENPKAFLWDSQERKDLQEAEKAFNKAIHSSEYSEIFEEYASLNDSGRW